MKSKQSPNLIRMAIIKHEIAIKRLSMELEIAVIEEQEQRRIEAEYEPSLKDKRSGDDAK